MLPAPVAAPDLPPANALVATSEQVAFSVGPLGAGTFAVAAGTVLAAPSVRAVAGSPLWTDIGAGLRWAARTAEVRAVLVVVAAATLSYAGLFGIGLPALARSTGGALGLGVLLSAWASASWPGRSPPVSPGCRGAGVG